MTTTLPARNVRNADGTTSLLPAVLLVDGIADAPHTCAGCYRTLPRGGATLTAHTGPLVVVYCTRACRATTVSL